MTPFDRFKADCDREIAEQGSNKDFAEATRRWIDAVSRTKYTYNFPWLGRPIIQYPQDIVAMQEMIWAVRPDLIVETGIAHGGSLIFSASMLELRCGGGRRRAEVLGIDIDIRAHKRAAIEAHPMAERIAMIEGSSVDPRSSPR